MKKWLKPVLTLVVLFLLVRFLPDQTVDPWSVFNPKKTVKMVFALTLIQFVGSFFLQLLGSRVGAILTGFFGGLVSSTATTASLAKRSKLMTEQKDTTSEALTFLAATIAMLIEGMVILLFGTKDVHIEVLIVFIAPLIAAGFLIFLNARKPTGEAQVGDQGRFDLLPIFKLSAFVMAILTVSKVLQNLLGQSGLLAFTFAVSLFEIHGSFMANIQLHDAGAFDVRMLGSLAALSIAASVLSKMFLIFTLGSASLKAQVRALSFFLFLSLTLGWLAFSWVV